MSSSQYTGISVYMYVQVQLIREGERALAPVLCSTHYQVSVVYDYNTTCSMNSHHSKAASKALAPCREGTFSNSLTTAFRAVSTSQNKY